MELTEQSKECDDLVAKFDSTRATLNVGESKLRDEFSLISAEITQTAGPQ